MFYFQNETLQMLDVNAISALILRFPTLKLDEAGTRDGKCHGAKEMESLKQPLANLFVNDGVCWNRPGACSEKTC